MSLSSTIQIRSNFTDNNGVSLSSGNQVTITLDPAPRIEQTSMKDITPLPILSPIEENRTYQSGTTTTNYDSLIGEYYIVTEFGASNHPQPTMSGNSFKASIGCYLNRIYVNGSGSVTNLYYYTSSLQEFIPLKNSKTTFIITGSLIDDDDYTKEEKRFWLNEIHRKDGICFFKYARYNNEVWIIGNLKRVTFTDNGGFPSEFEYILEIEEGINAR
jgi:hypothetical protein